MSAGGESAGPAQRAKAGARRQLGYAVLAAVVGAAVALFATSQVWADVEVTGVVGARLPREQRTGGEVLPWMPALALVALAGAGALLATRGTARVLVGGLLVLCGVGVAGGGGYAITEGAPIGWPALAAVGGLVVVHAGVAALVRGRRWPAMGARYERVSAINPRPAGGSPAMWDALDRGEDPTR